MSEDVKDAAQLLHYEPPVPGRSFSWQPLLAEPLRAEAQAAALCVAERMRNSSSVLAIAQKAQEQSTQQSGWSPLALCGIAMFYSHLARCFPQQGWDVVAQQHLRQAAAWTQQMPFETPGLFGGTCSLLLPLHWLSAGGTRYQKTLAHIRQQLCEQILQRRWRRADEEGGVADSDYDVISGAAGTLAGLLLLEHPGEQEKQAIEVLLAYLTWLAAPDQPLGKERWYAPPALLPTEQHRASYPEGCFNCGLAHGIAGPLAALSLAWRSGYRYPGLQEAISFLSNWLLRHQISDSWGCSWPPAIPYAAALAAEQWQAVPGTHAGWCYGAPGIAYSLWQAGEALPDEGLRQKAREAVEAALRRPPAERRLHSPTLCHGKAGLLLICLHFAHTGASALIREHIPLLTQQILASFNPDTPLGFQDMEGPVVAVDQPNWLTGAPGVALALLAASTDVFPVWDRMLLLS
ncbi:hypothetical protein EPA93_05225 [Ktedonosporobacter rubrisoli]|uniref:Lanthionine synthetase n=1 Tax=Ktedonosporobacter rubrisoli TaxID=2509675 RepID=A0A4P6JJX0_KTERU|nr:lanthionine synthetase C family protein [Ktedonosporobacter rubrisoli]QBD75435.1 hypothetical protein EPA93_05225 [Ktedonosporobacter rubrisoli]